MDSNRTIKVLKRVVHNGIEIRRSNEATTRLGKQVYAWIYDDVTHPRVCAGLESAQREIDQRIALEATRAHDNREGFWVVRPIDGKFTIVEITQEEWRAIQFPDSPVNTIVV